MGFIVFIIIMGIISAGIWWSIVIVMGNKIAVSNKKKLKEMDEKIKDFKNKSFSTQEEKEKAKQQLKEELIKIKAGITDYRITEEARDKINIL